MNNAIRNPLSSSEDLLRHSLIALLGGFELRTLTPNLFHSSLCSRICLHLESFGKVVLNTTSPTIWGYPHIVTLEEQLVKARSSMALWTYLMLLFHLNFLKQDGNDLESLPPS